MRAARDIAESIMLLTGTQIIMVLLGTLGPGFADKVMHIDIRDASLFIVAPAVVGILAGVVWVGTVGYKHNSRRLITFGVNAAGWILFCIAASVWLINLRAFHWLTQTHAVLPIEVTLFFLLGFANSCLDVPANAMLQDKARGALHGRVYGMLTAFIGGVGILPVVVGGILADTIGIGNVLFILGAGIIFYGIYRIRYNRQ